MRYTLIPNSLAKSALCIWLVSLIVTCIFFLEAVAIGPVPFTGSVYRLDSVAKSLSSPRTRRIVKRTRRPSIQGRVERQECGEKEAGDEQFHERILRTDPHATGTATASQE